ncbi:MAG: hypothetical protein LCH46_12825 [Proteobacteria bacterium]|nr:hypothetical protein [Pseudomonadota bacterium]
MELRNLAKGAELQSTRSLLELTYYAAYAAAHQVEMPEGELERLDRLGEDARRAGAAVVAAAAE